MKSSNILVIFTIFSTCCFICLAQNTPQDFLDAHNKARAEVGVGELFWDETLEEYAKNYAESKIESCEMKHSGGNYGENLVDSSDPEMTAAAAVQYWVDEKKYYDNATNSCVGGECKHYTQLVWRDSFHLGCAKAHCKNGWSYFVCSYDPPGNYVGERPY